MSGILYFFRAFKIIFEKKVKSILYPLYLHKYKSGNYCINYDCVSVNEMAQLSNTIKDEIVLNAKKIMNNQYSIFGKEFACKTNLPDWKKDYLLDLNENIVQKYDLKYDLRVVWELNRLHFLPLLGMAYIITKDVKYFYKFQELTLSWKSFYLSSKNSKFDNAMECGIRIVNIGLATILFKDAIGKDKFLEEQIKDLLRDLSIYIYSHFEITVSGTKSNHYLCNLLGLIFFSLLFPNSKLSKKYKFISVREFEKEILNQTHPDGINFEHSIHYHRFSLEIFIYAYHIAEMLDIEFSDNYKQSLIKMLNFVYNYIRPDGSVPNIGDNDSGRILKILDYFNVSDKHDYLIDYYNFLRGNIDYKELVMKKFNEFSLFITKNLKPIKNNSFLPSYYFKDSKVVFFKEDGIFLSVLAWGVGTNGIGNHQHNDQMSFEFGLNYQNIIIDSGSFVYTASNKYRNFFRSSQSHNTLLVDSKEIHYLNEEKLFKLKKNSVCEIENFDYNNNIINIVVVRKDKESNILHKRTFNLDFLNQTLNIYDSVSCSGKHNVEIFFHFNEKAALSIINSNQLLCNLNNKKFLLSFVKMGEKKLDNIKIELLESKVSHYYYTCSNNKLIKLNGIFLDRLDLITNICPIKNNN